MAAPRKLTGYSPPGNSRLPLEVYSEPGSGVLFTIRAYRGQPFAANPELCGRVTDLLAQMRLEYGCWVGAYCLMPDHLHCVSGVREEGRSVLTFVDRFKGKTTNASWQHGWTGRLWQSRSHDHVVRDAEGLLAVYTYVLENPARAGLAGTPEDWPWAGVLDDVF